MFKAKHFNVCAWGAWQDGSGQVKQLVKRLPKQSKMASSLSSLLAIDFKVGEDKQAGSQNARPQKSKTTVPFMACLTP